MGAEVQSFEARGGEQEVTGDTQQEVAAKITIVAQKPHLVVWYKFQRKNPFTTATDDVEVLAVDMEKQKVKLKVTTTKLWPNVSEIPLERYENLHDTKIQKDA